jgi:molybdate transport system regulatory protein
MKAAVPIANPMQGVRIDVGRRIWLQDMGEPVFGTGVRELLVRVEATGSLRRAAADMGMAYSKAWQVVRRAEEHLGFALLDRRAGGKTGGGSVVTAEGRWLIGAFGALLEEAGPLIEELYRKHFGDWPSAAETSAAGGVAGRRADG